jgi:hypothetical protein
VIDLLPAACCLLPHTHDFKSYQEIHTASPDSPTLKHRAEREKDVKTP